MATQTGKIATTVYFDKDEHYRLKMVALKRQETLTKLVNEQIMKWVAEIEAREAASTKQHETEAA